MIEVYSHLLCFSTEFHTFFLSTYDKQYKYMYTVINNSPHLYKYNKQFRKEDKHTSFLPFMAVTCEKKEEDDTLIQT